MPPAFILSQDQTLQKKLLVLFAFPSYSKLTLFCLVFKDHCTCVFASCVINISNFFSDVNIFLLFLYVFLFDICCYAQRVSNISILSLFVNAFFVFFFIYFILKPEKRKCIFHSLYYIPFIKEYDHYFSFSYKFYNNIQLIQF